MPSRRSAIHDLLGRAGVTNGVALDSVGMSASMMLGPILAGALITLFDPKGSYVAIVLIYVVSLALVTRLRLTREVWRGGGASVLGDLAMGLRYIVGNATMRATILITVLMNLLLFPYMHMVPVMARDVLHVGAVLMGVLQAAAGFGALTGAVVIASAMSIRYHGRLFVAGSMFALTALLMFSLSGSYFLSLATLMALGLGTSGFSTMQSSMMMLVAREDMRGKALGVTSLAIGVGPVGALLVGAIASALSAGIALRLIAVAGILCVGFIAILMPSLRRQILPDERSQYSDGPPGPG
jgi:MFS family permease